MTRTASRCLSLFALSVLTLGAVGCGKVTGGGWTPSLNPDGGRATFGFEMRVEEKPKGSGNNVPSGQVQYDDHAFAINGVQVRFHGVVTDGLVYEEDWVADGYYPAGTVLQTGYFQGTYTPEPANAGPGGTFEAEGDILSVPGVPQVSLFGVALHGGALDGYFNYQPLGGGHVRIGDIALIFGVQ